MVLAIVEADPAPVADVPAAGYRLLPALLIAGMPMMLSAVDAAGSLQISVGGTVGVWALMVLVHGQRAAALGLVLLPSLFLTWGLVQVAPSAAALMGAALMALGLTGLAVLLLGRSTLASPTLMILGSVEPLQEWLWPERAVLYSESQDLAPPPSLDLHTPLAPQDEAPFWWDPVGSADDDDAPDSAMPLHGAIAA